MAGRKSKRRSLTVDQAQQLVPYKRYANGRVKSWRHPDTKRVVSDWERRTYLRGGINPRMYARLKRQSPDLAAFAVLRAQSRPSDQSGIRISEVIKGWARKHEMTFEEASEDVEMWDRIPLIYDAMADELTWDVVFDFFEFDLADVIEDYGEDD